MYTYMIIQLYISYYWVLCLVFLIPNTFCTNVYLEYTGRVFIVDGLGAVHGHGAGLPADDDNLHGKPGVGHVGPQVVDVEVKHGDVVVVLQVGQLVFSPLTAVGR